MIKMVWVRVCVFVFVQQQEEPDDDENVMDLDALKSRTTHTVSFAAATKMNFKM